MSVAPGQVRDSIVAYLSAVGNASLEEIYGFVGAELGEVPASSVRSYLNLNTPGRFARTAKGRYSLVSQQVVSIDEKPQEFRSVKVGKATLYSGDCRSWLSKQAEYSIHAVITDPPYGLNEYSTEEQAKLRRGKGGLWRIPPSFDGHRRSPLPRFTVLSDDDRASLQVNFKTLAALLFRVVVPGGNVAIASNPLLSHLVSSAFAGGGFEIRGSIVRLTMTMRGGDRPKNAHEEFSDVSVMPRSMWEPWVIARKIATVSRVLCASPSYLARRGTPGTPDQLAAHSCLRLARRNQLLDRWRFAKGSDAACEVKGGGALSSGDGGVLREWALAGEGISLEASWDVADDLRAGRLVEILPSYRSAALDLYAAFGPTKPSPPRIRLFVDHLVKAICDLNADNLV